MKTKILIALLKDKRVQIGIAAVLVGIFVPLILLIAAVGSVFAGFSGDGGDRDAAYYQYIVPEIRRVNQLYGTDDRIDERQAYAVYVETIKKDYELTWEIGERFAGCFYTISKESGQDKLKILQLPEILEKISAGFPLVQLDADAETSIQFITGLLFEGSGENNVGTKTTAANGNEYFKRTEKNHYPSGELLKKYYEAPGVNLWGQCPWYVRGRLYEMTGQRIPDGLRGNASQWYRANLNLGAGGYRSSSDPLQPKVGAVVCWGDKPSKITANGGNNYGHVAVIEEIYADGTMLISECNGGTANRYRDKYDKITHAFNTRVISMYSLDTSSQYFIGYIYSMD